MKTESCPKCKSKRTSPNGFRETQRGNLQRLKCRRCGKTFYPKRIRELIAEEKRARKFRALGQYIWLVL